MCEYYLLLLMCHQDNDFNPRYEVYVKVITSLQDVI